MNWRELFGTLFAKKFVKSIQNCIIFDKVEISFFEFMEKLAFLNPNQNFSISSSFKIDEIDMLLPKNNYAWMRCVKNT